MERVYGGGAGVNTTTTSTTTKQYINTSGMTMVLGSHHYRLTQCNSERCVLGVCWVWVCVYSDVRICERARVCVYVCISDLYNWKAAVPCIMSWIVTRTFAHSTLSLSRVDMQALDASDQPIAAHTRDQW